MYHHLFDYPPMSADECATLSAKILRVGLLQPGPGGTAIIGFSGEGIVEMIGAPPQTIVRIALACIWPGSQIQAHADAPIPEERIHIPIQANSGCWSFSDGQWQQLRVGCPYLMDPAIEHGAVNWGSDLRIHLMIDRKKVG
jgi:hypothetical protein